MVISLLNNNCSCIDIIYIDEFIISRIFKEQFYQASMLNDLSTYYVTARFQRKCNTCLIYNQCVMLRFRFRYAVLLTEYVATSWTRLSRDCRRRCCNASRTSRARCRVERAPGEVIILLARATLWRRCICGSRCCKCPLASTSNDGTATFSPANYSMRSTGYCIISGSRRSWTCRTRWLMNFSICRRWPWSTLRTRSSPIFPKLLISVQSYIIIQVN